MEKILIVDDIETQLQRYKEIVQRAIGDCQIYIANNGGEALKIIQSEPGVSVVIQDLNFSTLPEDKIIGPDPHREGLYIAQRLREINPDLQIVLTTCFDELDEPFVIRLDDTSLDIKQKIKLAVRVAQLERENKELRRLLYVKTNLVGQAKSLMKVLDNAIKATIGDDKEPILILGESGTGKELLAKFIHSHSPRREKPFFIVNCAAVPDNLIESELFGIEKRAVTGVERKSGKLELADGGMLFLDEIGDMDLKMQAKLLRILDHAGFERLGGVKTIRPDIRFIFATNKDLQAKIQAGRFRDDLYYRLGALHLYLPPLRERKDDIPLLAAHFLKVLAEEGKKAKGLSPELMKLLISYHWPGNVRELQSIVRRMAILSQNEILDVADLPEDLRRRLQANPSNCSNFEELDEMLSRFPESDKIRLLQLFMETEDTVTRIEIKTVLGLGDAAANERIQMFINLGLIRKVLRKYQKTELLVDYWEWLHRNERNENRFLPK